MTDKDGSGKGEVKDLEYYKMHPEEMPSDIESIEALADLGTDGAPVLDTSPGNAVADIGDEVTLGADMPAPVKAPEKEAEPSAEPTETPVPILARDGKSTIPYSQLENARKLEKEARKKLEAANAELEALRKQPDPPKVDPSSTPEPTPDPVEADAETPDFGGLRDEFPDAVIDAMEATHKVAVVKVQKLEAKIDRLEAADADVEAAEKADMDEQVRDAIDKNETLSDWEANNPEMWGKALKVDDFLRTQTDGEWAGSSFADRFEKVVELTKAMEPAKQPSSEPTAEEIKARAEEKLREAGSAVPTSMSSIPGGSPPPQNEQENIEQTSEVQLAAKFEKMTQEQQDEYLSKLGV